MHSTRRIQRLLGCAVTMALLAQGAALADSGPTTTRVGKKIDNVTLKDAAGKTWSLYDLKDRKAVVAVFLSFECPVSTSYSQLLADLSKTYGERGVAFVAFSPNPDETAEQVARQARDHRLPFPTLGDGGFRAAEAFKAEVTPEAFVLDSQFVLRYRGRIDNGYTSRLKRNISITRHDVREALDAVLAGQPVQEPATQAVGCPIQRQRLAQTPVGAVTYHRDVLPILQNHCQNCHRPGEVGPFSLMTYRQAVNWAADVKEYTQARKMPPWKPVAGVPFHHERRLSDREIATLAAWVDGGTPEGDAKEAPAPRQFAEGWQLGQPDLVLTVADDFQVGPSGRDLFRCFVLPTNLTEDKYVTAIEVRPGNPRIVHHTLQFIDTTGQGRKLEAAAKARGFREGDQDSGPGYTVSMGVGFLPQGGLSGWAPGQMPRYLPQGTGFFLPKGADLVMQVHYHRNGRVERDRTSIGLHFAKQPVKQRFQGLVVPGGGRATFLLAIPKDVPDHKVTGSIWIDQDIDLHSVMPHMHLIGKKIKVTVTPPEGSMQTLVAIDDWDYNWQETYFLRQPLQLKAGTRFDVEAVYDNSTGNPNNPHNPPQIVRFGEQTTNEMCFVFLGATSVQPGRIRPRFEPLRRAEDKPAR